MLTGQEKLIAGTSYMIPFVPFFTEKTDFISFHLIQATGIWLILILAQFIPAFGWLINTACFFVIIFLAVQAFIGQKFQLGPIHELTLKLLEKLEIQKYFLPK